ncbi:ROK family transcriptional regulator [Microbacterium sp. USHLN186]|uniref:ROK family transcriptional regulator n=1 Tax=Microbacterium sp. USHLN186 TaxID=3081286 RepID=UPI003015E6C4
MTLPDGPAPAPLVFGEAQRLRSAGKVLPEQARAHNRALVLQTLYHRGGLSRADLARETGLTRVTISDLVAECIADGIVVETGVRAASGPGKPAVLLDIDRAGHHIIGVDLSGTQAFHGAVLDLDGQVLERYSIALPERADPEQAYAAVRDLVQQLVRSAQQPILGIGIGSPGLVRPDGFVVSAPNLSWTDMPLEQRLHEELALPVLVRNDANAAVLAEYTFGSGGSDLMLVRIGRGVGAGVITGGRQVLGSRFAAGEIGHVVIDADAGPLCVCGRHGCLEAWVNAPRLRELLAAAPDRGEVILESAGARLGSAVAPIVAALDLAEVVLAAPAELLTDAFVRSAATSLHAHTLPGVFANVRVRPTAQQDIVLRGAAVMVLHAQLGVS